MNINKDIPLKVYLLQNASEEREIRRFSVRFPSIGSYGFLVKELRDVFPGLSDKMFAIYWEDEEGDEVAVSSDEELLFALECKVNDPVKKIFVKVQSPAMGPKQNENEAVHLGVICDGCDKSISGVRFKCAVCLDYDLCSRCRDSGTHDEHPMLRIPHPLYFDRCAGLGGSSGKHRSRRHSDCGKKRRRYDKRESGPETGDESEETHYGKYFHKKCRRAYKCPYTQMMTDLLGFFNPTPFQPRQSESQNGTNGANQNGEPFPHMSYLKNLGSSLQKILDPLGLSVEFEVRPKEEKKTEKEEEKQPSTSASSAPNQKEVRFSVNEKVPENMMQKIEEITKMLANQTVTNGTESDNGWVSFEELKKGSEEPQPTTNAETPKASQPSAPEETKKEETQSQNLYPNLTPRVPSNPAVRAALESMISMGFTNEGNWLTSLLEAKNGDINQALEALSFQNKATK